MMSKGNDSGTYPAVSFTIKYNQQVNGWESGTLVLYVGATQTSLANRTGAWYFYDVEHYDTSFGANLQDSGGNTAAFSITITQPGAGTGLKTAIVTITCVNVETSISVQCFFSSVYGVVAIT